MKKQFLFGMAAVAALCSCSNNEVMEAPESLQTPVTFGTYVGNSVNGRAAVIDDNALRGDVNLELNEYGNQAGFGVFGYYTGSKNYGEETNKKPNFMYNEMVYYQTPGWKYGILKYWPNNPGDNVSFFAYAPYATGATNNSNFDFATNYSDMTVPQIKFTVNQIVKNQQDLLWANQIDKTKPGINSVDPVKFDFQHALARVGFKVEAMFDKVHPGGDEGAGTTAGTADSENGTYNDEQTTISVQKVELIGKFRTKGTMDLAAGKFVDGEYTTISNSGNDYKTTTPEATLNGTTPEDVYGFQLDYNGDNLTSNFVNGVAEKVTTTAQLLNAADSYIMLIPQNFSVAPDESHEAPNSDKLKIRVTYTVKTTDTKLPTGQSEITNVITSNEFSFNFEAQKAYTFNLHLGMTSAKFSATVQAWDNNSNNVGTVVNVPINTNN